VLHDAPDRQLDDCQRAQLQFDLGVSSVSLGRLAAAEKHFSSCEAALSRSDPALLPCLLNHGLVLLRLGKHQEAVSELQRARHLCDGLGSSRTRDIRARVLSALGAALLGSGDRVGAEAVYRTALEVAEKGEEQQQQARASADAGATAAGGSSGGGGGCNYFGVWSSGSSSSRASSSCGASCGSRRESGPRVQRVPQESRAALAALLQSRGEHGEAAKLLLTQLKALRAAHARGEPCGEERAYTAGRLAISAFATRRDTMALAALREATEVRMAHGKGGDGAEAVHAWVASMDEPLPLARAALRARVSARKVAPLH